MSSKIKKGDGYCRLCKHMYKHHCIFAYVQHGDMMQTLIHVVEVVPCNGINFHDGNLCGCVGFEPQDNLEYLEWKSQQKNQLRPNDNVW